MPRYNHATIEPKWQAYWDAHQTFATPRMPKPGTKKLYALDMFPYPSGDGLHVGHPEGYTATDIVCRAARMQGRSVIHPMGFDAFGLPAEEHAIKTGEHPRSRTEKNIDTFRRQLKSLGFSYDWSRELATTDVEYFRWTQWIFLQIYDTWFDHEQQRGRPISELPIPAEVKSQGDDAVRTYQDEHRLAYQTEAPVNWCPALGTVLANEEVINGKSERGSHPVVRMPLRQWMLRITAYADRLEKDLEALDWSEGIKALQRNWIGRSTGAEVDFFIGPTHLAPGESPGAAFEAWKAARTKSGFPRKPDDDVLRIYTTRPDTLFGATYMVIAPEHPFVERLTTPKQKSAVEAYREAAARKSDLDRTELAKEKTGVFTGSYAINPVNGEATPIWVADYVLISYGTGAIMAVPAHDERDFEFAEQFKLPITAVVDPGKAVSPQEREEVLAGKRCSAEDGIAINSGKYNGLTTAEFKQKIAADLADARPRPRRRQLQTPRLALLPPTLLGRTLPDPPRARRRRQTHRPHPRRRRERPARRPAPPRRFQTPRPPRTAARKSTRKNGSTPPSTANATSAKPTPCPNGPARAGTTCAFSTPPTRTPADRSGAGKGLDARRSIHRRRRARRAPSPLLALLAQSPLRSRHRQHARAVSEARQPGHDPGRQ